jgi:hypothetical protein
MIYAQTKQTTLIVDRGQAKAQLQLLGYQPGDSVYMRFFVPDTDPRYGTPEAARKANKLNWTEVERYQNDGYGVYFVINGGGHTDKDVKVGRALFCEWDDRPIEDQTFAWQELNLLEPSMQVSTRKSVHNYWRADLTKEQWIELQKDLLAYTQSDQKLKNPSRVLRLAGAYHIKPGCDPIRCDIIHQTERVYTYEELRSAIPRLQQPEQPAISYQPSISEDVPLYQFLTKDDRALIDQGAAQGSRNGSGAKLARNLIGTAARLNYLGIQFSGDSRQLFDGYCHRCNPPIASRESDAIWKSAQKNNPTASLTDEALENCAKAWLRNQEKASGRGFTSGNGSNGGNRRNFGGGSGSGGGDDGHGGDHSEEGFTEQNFWAAPETWHGEIGWLFPAEDEIKFHPKCNFDFQVERELESEDGGGVVLQVKRSLDSVQKRVIINSVDYGSVKTFEKALKQALGAGIVINLKDEQLKALIHVRLRDYRERGGKLYRLIDRYGQQPDGTWVFRDRQYTKDGEPTNEDESGWVFNPALGKEDFIPCPELAPEDSEALKRLVDACRVFFGEANIHQVFMTMGWVTAGIHSQAIFKQDNCFPLLNSNGEPGACKTLAAEAALSLVGKNWAQMGMLARVSVSALYEHGSRTAGLPFLLDDPERSSEIDEIFKTWYNWKPRRVRGNDQQPKSPLGAITNHVVGAEQAATFTRFIRLTYERASGGNKQAFQELRKAQESASGAFPLILKMGYDPEAIAAIELELLPHLPLAHARIAQSLAIPLYYAQKLIELTGHSSSYNLKQWVIEHCCASENDSDNSADSLQDFIDKLLTLESEASVGSWNFKRDIQRNGKNYAAIFAADVWALVDKRFSPATYNFKSLKPLILKAQGITDTTVRFDRDRDSVLAFERAKITTDKDSHGDLNPPETIPRKAWLVPITVFEGNNPHGRNNLLRCNTPAVTENVTGVTGCNRISVTRQNDDISMLSVPLEVHCNRVTEKKEIEIETEKAVQAESLVEFSCEASENSGYTSYTVTDSSETAGEQGLQPVTEVLENPVTKELISVTPENLVTDQATVEKVTTDTEALVSDAVCDNESFDEEEVEAIRMSTTTDTPGESQQTTFEEKVEAIAPTPAHADTAEGENPVTPVEIELEAAELLTVGETPQTITVEPVEPVEASFDEEVAFLVVILASEAICPNRDELALYRRLYSPAALNAACKQLSPSRHAQIRQWVIELNEATAVTSESKPLPPALPTSSKSEILTSGEAVGRLVHTRNIKGEVSSEAMRITKWCDGNGFYTLENGDTAYPFQLVLATSGDWRHS